MSALLVVSVAVAAATTLALLLALVRWAPRLGLVDVPNRRSSHDSARPRGGGAAIVGGLLAGCAAFAGFAAFGSRGAIVPPATATVLAAAVAIAALGFWDDLQPLGARLRLAGQSAVAVAMVALLGGLPRLPLPPPADLALAPAAGAALAILWLVAVTNFFNFMDGIDGLAAGQALITFLAMATAGGAPGAAAPITMLAATLLIFLAFNWAPARLFLGDVGSGFLGFLVAASPWLGPADLLPANILLVALVLSLFLLDPLWTLAARWRRGARLTESHREHLYQQLVGSGGRHAPVAAAILVVAALLAVLAVWSYRDAVRGWWSLAAALLLFLGELWLARR